MALPAKLLISRCIKPNSMGSKSSVLPHQVLAVSPTSNIVHYASSMTSLHAPKLSISVVVSHSKKTIHLCTLITSLHGFYSS